MQQSHKIPYRQDSFSILKTSQHVSPLNELYSTSKTHDNNLISILARMFL